MFGIDATMVEIDDNTHMPIHASVYCIAGITDLTSGKIDAWDCRIFTPYISSDTAGLFAFKKKRSYYGMGEEFEIPSLSNIYDKEYYLRKSSISEVYINGIRTKLKEPFVLDVKFEYQQYIITYDDLGLLAINESPEMAINEINEEFSELWEDYINCPEDELTEDAKMFRSKLKGLVIYE